MINGKAVIKFNAPSPPATPHRADGLIHARARAFRKTNARGFYDVPPFFLFFFSVFFRRILMTRPRKKGDKEEMMGGEEEKNRVILFALSSEKN